MGRSVVLAGAARCPRCSLPPRWCVCDVLPPVETQLHVHVLIHRHEHCKPSSTGKLVARTVANAVSHVYQRENRFHPAAGFPADAIAAGEELWVLHPSGEALMGVLRATGDLAAERRLRLHFELHVYATLLARGRREMAERYLGHSPLLTEAPEALGQLHARQRAT